LLGIGILLLLIAALLAPFESLGWWAGWFGRSAAKNTAATSEQKASEMQLPAEAQHYLVYLSGIDAISGDFLEREEIDLCDQLAARFPGTIVVKDVFPYAMNNRGLTSQRLFTWLWKRIVQVKLRKKTLLTNLINVRNMFQVAVSADRRYGPIYNYGTAEVIRDELLRQGYRVGSGKPVTIIGYSGGRTDRAGSGHLPAPDAGGSAAADHFAGRGDGRRSRIGLHRAPVSLLRHQGSGAKDWADRLCWSLAHPAIFTLEPGESGWQDLDDCSGTDRAYRRERVLQ